eukprot:1324911-Amphidinium_carterae.1
MRTPFFRRMAGRSTCQIPAVLPPWRKSGTSIGKSRRYKTKPIAMGRELPTPNAKRGFAQKKGMWRARRAPIRRTLSSTHRSRMADMDAWDAMK